MYRIFDIVLDSDIPLPELSEVDYEGEVIRVRRSANSSRLESDIEWFHDLTDPAGQVCISCGRDDRDIILRFPNLMDVWITEKGSEVEYVLTEQIPPETIRHIILDQVIPRVLGQQGRLVVHASAVVLPNGKGVAFLGESGWGKSTIASSFYQVGARLITDDCLLIEERNGKIRGIPNYNGLRLFSDSANMIFKDSDRFTNVSHYSLKRRLILREQDVSYHEQGIPLDAIFLLGDPAVSDNGRVVSEPVTAANEFMTLLGQMFVLDVKDKQMVAEKFTKTGEILSSDVDVYTLDYPRDHGFLPLVRSAIESALN